MPSSPPSTFSELVELFLNLINIAIPTLFGVLFVIIIWKIVDAWIINAGDETKVAEGKQFVLVAVLVLVVMVSTWGIVLLIRNSLFGSF